MTMTTSGFLDLSVVIALFSAIIGCYVYVFRIRGQVEGKISTVNDELQKRLDTHVQQSETQVSELRREVSAMNVALTNRLTAIETTLNNVLPSLLKVFVSIGGRGNE